MGERRKEELFVRSIKITTLKKIFFFIFTLFTSFCRSAMPLYKDAASAGEGGQQQQHPNRSARTFYETLGVKKTDSFYVIRRQRRKMQLRLHPDRPCTKKFSSEQQYALFHLVECAFEVIHTPELRQKYDALLASGTCPRHGTVDNTNVADIRSLIEASSPSPPHSASTSLPRTSASSSCNLKEQEPLRDLLAELLSKMGTHPSLI